MVSNIKVATPKGCENAPRKVILRDFNVAFVTMDRAHVLENLDDKISWNVIGDEKVEEKEKFIHKWNNFYTEKVTELQLHDIITHGYVASVHGKVIAAEESYDFCHVYKFTGVVKTAKIKEITSYIIPPATK